jgi:hypothetical protein
MPSRVTRRGGRRGCGSISGAIAGDGLEVAPAADLRNEHRPLPVESVATILENDRDAAIQYWMELVKHDEELICIPLSFEDRMGHLRPLFADLVNRLRYAPTAKANISTAAREHGDMRRTQGYTVAMLVEESRILEVSIFSTLHNNLQRLDFSKVLLDVVTIADEVDSQLKQAVVGYAEAMDNSATTWHSSVP